MLNRCSG